MTILLDDNKINEVFKTEFNSDKIKLKNFIENILLNIKDYKNFNYEMNNMNLNAFTNHSAENVDEWSDESEDELWK